MNNQKSKIIKSDSVNLESPPIKKGGGDGAAKDIGEIVTVVTAMLSAAGGMKILFEMVKLWIEERKERRIKLKSGDLELELQGSMSQKEINQKIELFRELIKDAKESDIKIIVPSDGSPTRARRII